MAKKMVKSFWDGNALSFWCIMFIMPLVCGALTAAGVFVAYKLGSFEIFGNSTPLLQDLFPMIGNGTPLMEELGLFKVTAKLLAGFAAIPVFSAVGFCWACIVFIKWDTKHTVISGRRLKFQVGTLNLIFNMIKWTFLTIITLGIYSIWMPVKVREWQIKHTDSSLEEDEYGWAAPEVTYYGYGED